MVISHFSRALVHVEIKANFAKKKEEKKTRSFHYNNWIFSVKVVKEGFRIPLTSLSSLGFA